MPSTRIQPPPRETLVKLYERQHLSLTQIATRYGVGRATVHNWLRTYNIPTRSPGRAPGARAH